ncbi:MAG: HIT family protein [Cellvibrio sp.]
MASVFSLIIEGSIPGHFVYQDDVAVAFMTIQPIRAGHVLVVPREEVDQWSDLSEETAAHLMKVAHKIANAQKTAFGCTRVGLMIAGLEVPHTHLHVIPMESMEDLSFANAKDAKQDELISAKDAIVKHL